jgi:hypothetical protein
MARDATLNVYVTDLPWFKEAVQKIRDLHKPHTEDVECWLDDEDAHRVHDVRFPECPGIDADDPDKCPGHEFQIEVCNECGYHHNGDVPVYRPWPCATLLAVDLSADDATPDASPRTDP